MIKNIVFDMGKVLVEYEGDRVCRHFSEDEALIRRVSTAVFASPEWIMLDMGLISEEEGLSQMTERLDTQEEKELAGKSFAHWHEYNMYHKEGMEELVRELKEEGYRIYLCSNASLRLLTCYHQVIPAIDCFDGIFFSAEAKCMKPQKEMYERFFERFGLKPEECFFIDDLERNIQGAKACGMDGYCFADGDIERLKIRLASLKEG